MQMPRESGRVPEGDETVHPVPVEPVERQSPDLEGGDRSMDPEQMTLEDIREAEAARPDLPGETDDGLDELDEEVRRQAEDLPADAARRD